MLWIVLPLAAIDLIRLIEIGFVEVRLVKILVNVLVIVVHVFVVHVNVDISAAPPAVPTPVPTPRGSQRDTGPKRDRRSSCIISWGGIVNRRIRVGGRTIDHRWVI
jgi:hypothetical protein